MHTPRFSRRLCCFWCILAGLAAAAIAPASAQVPSKPGEWPQWRGPNRDGISTETGLAKQWPEKGPAKLWEVNHVGVGYSSLSIKAGRILTQGDLAGVEHVICLNARDGSVIWAVQPGPSGERLAARLTSEMKRLDKNTDGKVDEAEALAGLGWQFNQFDSVLEGSAPPALAAERAARILKLLDANQDGKLSFAEAPKFSDNFAGIDVADKAADAVALAKSRTAEIAKAADKNSDGKLDKQETRGTAVDKPFGRIDQKSPETGKGDEILTVEEIEAYFAKNEAGCDGLLSLEELRDYYARAFPGRDGQLTADELKGYYGGYRNGFGDGPRGTPTIDGDRVYVEGGSGDLSCLDFATGKTLWHKHLVTDFKGSVPGWGYSESPLIEGGLVIVTPGGSAGTVVALDKLSGNVVWRCEGAKEGAHYSSPIAADLAGVRQIVQMASKNVFGMTASSGELLWQYSKANNGTANCATPIAAKDHVFASSAYGTGGGLVKLTAEDKKKADEVYFDKAMANHHGGMILVGDHLYGFGNGGLLCMNFLTGESAWKARSVSKGSLTVADGMLYLLGENHEMALADVSTEKYIERGRFKIDNLGRPSWAHPVVAGGVLYIRNQGRLAAYDVKQQGAE